MALCTSFSWDEPFYKIPPDYSSSAYYGIDFGEGNDSTVLSMNSFNDAAQSMKDSPGSAYKVMDKYQKFLDEEYHRMIKQQNLSSRSMMQCAPTAQEIRMKEQDFKDMKWGIFPNGDIYAENAILRGNVKKPLPPHKIQLLKYRIKYLRMAHPELENWCMMHDVRGMEVEELYRVLKSKI